MSDQPIDARGLVDPVAAAKRRSKEAREHYAGLAQRIAVIVVGPGAMCRTTEAEAEDIAQEIVALFIEERTRERG